MFSLLMTKAEAIERVLRDNNGLATWPLLYNQIAAYYPAIHAPKDWKAALRGILYRDLGKRFQLLGDGLVALLDYDETRLALAADLHGPTAVSVLVSIRRGQGRFRKALEKECKICPITGLADRRLLLASHIKPWALATDAERLDPYNGFLFSPTIDKLFDRGLISFRPDARLLVSASLSAHSVRVLGLVAGQAYPALPLEPRQHYLVYHREAIFQP